MVVPKVFCLVWIFALEAEHSHVSMRDDFRQDSTQPRGLPEAYPPNALVNCGCDHLGPAAGVEQVQTSPGQPREAALRRNVRHVMIITM